jgi:hypothetical protein
MGIHIGQNIHTLQCDNSESTVHEGALELFSGFGYTVLHGPHIAPGELLDE